jgi:hypothetical protein
MQKSEMQGQRYSVIAIKIFKEKDVSETEIEKVYLPLWNHGFY